MAWSAASPYRTLSVLNVLRHGTRGEKLAILGGWALLSAASVLLGVASVAWRWSGLPVSFGGVAVYVTAYPPLLICLSLTLALGWLWGAIPAYLSTLTLALYAGMPLPWALLFAFANPLGFAVMAIGYQAIGARRDLRDLGSFLFYVQLSFVASIFGSSGALIWCYTNGIDRTAELPIWQGWWLGSFLQSVFIVGPLMALCWPRHERWQARRVVLMRAAPADPRGAVIRLLAAVAGGVLVSGFVTLALAGAQLERAAAGGGPPVAAAVATMRATTSVFFWVFAAIMGFIAFFGYQLFMHWQRSNDALLAELHEANEALETLATTDGLTGLLNRRAAEQRLRDEWHRAGRLGGAGAGALVMLDIDHFKAVNDQHGHAAGDEVIRRIALAIRAEKRQVDIACRHGGEEFLVMLPQADAEGARQFAERLRRRVEAEVLSVGGDDGGAGGDDGAAPTTAPPVDLRVTISLGVAVFDPADRTPAQWLARADRALYRAKQAGRNRTEEAAPLSPPPGRATT